MTKNNASPLVSVIVPIYKVENYICECVDSIILQSYKNLEIILVDDGSPDRCPEICDEYAQKDSRIKVIHKPNGGLSDARNAGIEIAKGDYLSFVDSDDVIHNQMIDVLMHPLIENKELKMSACQSLNFNDGEEFDSNQEIKPIEIIDYKLFFAKSRWMTAWGKVYKSELFKEIRYPIGRIHEDEFVTYKLCYEAKKIAYSESRLLFYRQREGSIMKAMPVKGMTDRYDALKGQVDFFFERNEIWLYSMFLINFAHAYHYSRHQKHTVCKNLLCQWECDLSNYTLSPLSFKQKINFILCFRFPRLEKHICKYFRMIK